MNRRQALGAMIATAAASGPALAQTAVEPFPMRKGVSLGNGLEAPSEGAWGYRLELSHIDAVADAGFDGVRIPVRWDVRTQPAAPYTIDPRFMERVDSIVAHALARGLKVQINDHHDNPLIADPNGQQERFRATWRQIAAHFADAPPALIFEILNEPYGALWPGPVVTETLSVALAEIRATNADRLVVIGGPEWNSLRGLRNWTPPVDPRAGGPRLALTVHYYDPFLFTHQGAGWVNPRPPPFPRPWGNEEDYAQLRRDAEAARDWAAAHRLPLQFGEFGAIGRISMEQRALWTRGARQAFEAAGAGWCVWAFEAGFPIWDARRRRIIPELRAALLA